MKLKSRKAAILLALGLIFVLMPIMPVAIVATTTNELNVTDAYASENERTASYVENARNIIAVSAYDNINKERCLFDGKAVAIADPYLEVRDYADDNSLVNGRMYKNTICDVLEQDDQWTKVKSGDVVGYVRSESLCFNDEAEALAAVATKVKATVAVESASVYANSTDGAEVVETLTNGTPVTPVKYIGSYLIINRSDNSFGYIAKDAVNIDYGFGEAVSIEEDDARIAAEEAAKRAAEEAKLAAQRAEAAKRAAEEERKRKMIAATSAGTDFTYNPQITVSDDDIWLMACIIDWESGWESYEGKLAVANVILNRVRSSRYPNTVSGVIYQRYQFSGVSDNNGNPSAAFQARLEKGPRTQECIKAAMEALSGKNNVRNFTAFLSVSIANIDSYSDYMIIGAHCFY